MPLSAVILIALVFAAFGAIGIYAGLPDFNRAIASRKWPKTNGLIEEVSEESHRPKGKGQSRIAIEYKVRYHYVVDDKAYTGKWNSLISTSNKPGMCLFKKGDVTDVYFDPVSFSDSRLFRHIRFQDIFLLIAGGIFTLFSVFPVILYLKLAQK
jgi:hypothetical protein